MHVTAEPYYTLHSQAQPNTFYSSNVKSYYPTERDRERDRTLDRRSTAISIRGGGGGLVGLPPDEMDDVGRMRVNSMSGTPRSSNEGEVDYQDNGTIDSGSGGRGRTGSNRNVERMERAGLVGSAGGTLGRSGKVTSMYGGYPDGYGRYGSNDRLVFGDHHRLKRSLVKLGTDIPRITPSLEYNQTSIRKSFPCPH